MLRTWDGRRIEGLSMKHGNPSFHVPSGWELLLSDISDSRPVCFIFQTSLDKAVEFRNANKLVLRNVRVVFFSKFVNIDLQIVAYRNEIEIWQDFGDVKLFSRQLELAASLPFQRIRPDESENLDLDMLNMLSTACTNSEVADLLRHFRTIQNIVQAKEEELLEKNCKEVSDFFNQTL